jgi:hypothetical protein
MKMRRIKRLWIPVLLGAVLIATLVGVAGARPNARPLAQPWRVLAVPAHACIPRDEAEDYLYQAGYLVCETGSCAFVCPMDFPAAGEQAVGAINVKRLTAYVLDGDGSASNVMTYLRKTYPMGGNSWQTMATASSIDGPSDPQTAMDTSIDNNPIYRSQAPYVWVSLLTANLRLYGLYIHYTW